MAKRRADKPLKIDMPFEDALKRILKAGPMPKAKPKARTPNRKSASK